jgi:ABC-type Fe3+ transport system permease subunit
MRSRARVLRAAVLGGAAMLGLAGAHALDYLLLYRNPVVRSGLLQQTGHAYFGKTFEFAIASAVLAAIGSFAFGVLRAHHPAERRSMWRAAGMLALIQSGGFVALEAGERLMVNAHAGQLLKVTLVGVVLQVIVATITAFVLSLIERAGRIIARALASVPPVVPAVDIFARPRDGFRPRHTLLTRASPRAPPLELLS